jgi:superfamily I DNA/RNA helicase
MITWLVPRQDLTPDQARVVELPPDSNRLVLGLAGSGKTQVLIHRAAYLAETYRVKPELYRAFVFTNVIKEYIRSGFEFLGLPEQAVSTFDFWCVGLYERHISSRLPRVDGGKTLDFRRIRRQALNHISSMASLQKSLDFVLVDEGQDLGPEVYDILHLSSHHVTVFADPQQKIFEDGADESFIMKKLRIDAPQVSLLGAYRNAAYVAQLASHFIADRAKRAQYLAQVSAEQRVRERPLCFVAATYDQELDRLAEIIRQRQVLNERIGIIVPTNRLVHGIAEGLAQRSVVVERAVTKEKAGKVSITCSFANLVPKIATFYMAKGLTFDSVLMPRLTERAYYWTKPDQRARILFVGIARATQWVYLSTVESLEFQEMAVLREAEKQRHLTIQASAAWKSAEQYRAGTERRDEQARQKGRRSKGAEDDEFSVL